MKAKLLTRINSLIALLVSMLGFSSCECGMMKYGVPIEAEYGVPYATFEAVGTITDEENKPLKDIRVQIKSKWLPADAPEDPAITATTDETGRYDFYLEYYFPVDSVDLVVRDEAGIYASDSVRVKVDYDRSNVSPSDHWNEGNGFVEKDFKLQKK